ncbi:hypothetical protein ACFVU2_18860 [Leifsonia sp. NPDC058194]|uniref:hypothetical protein n=1 Tax=Leifsonia sp. NPDC058194 TaxID=3346374 RepID=UPI0036D91B13
MEDAILRPRADDERQTTRMVGHGKETTPEMMLGTLAGACATRVAAKPYDLTGPASRKKYREKTEIIVGKLHEYLSHQNPSKFEFEARMLVDHGGFEFSIAYDNFMAFSSRQRDWVLERLPGATQAAAKAIASRATRHGWEAMLAEAMDAAGWFIDERHMVHYVNDGGRRVAARADLLVRLPFLDERPLDRLIVDLKYHQRLAEDVIEADLAEIVRRYGRPYADLFGRPVACVILAFNERDGAVWSEDRRVAPRPSSRTA